MDLSTVTFLDVEADRAGRLLEIALVRGDEAARVRIAGRTAKAIGADLVPLALGIVAGHNLARFDLPLLRAAGLGPEVVGALDTFVAAMIADPTRLSYGLPKSDPVLKGAVPDPVADAREARTLLIGLIPTWEGIEREVGEALAWLLDVGGNRGLRWLWERLHGPVTAPSLAAALGALPESLLCRCCRVRLPQLAATLANPVEHVGLALALRFVSVASRDGRLVGPPGAALVAWPRFHELTTRLMGPLCPDHQCPHRLDCEVHRPFAEDVLREVFELPGFRPHQREIVEAVLADRRPLAILPTGGGKSLCYQVPAVHGAQRLRGLTVVVSPLQALMADQVRSLSGRYTGTALINSSLLQEDRRRVLAGVRTGQYDILYLGPEQLRNPSIVRLLSRRLPFLWVVDEAHCISQWGHGFRTDYTYLTRAIAHIHGPERRPLVALFTATAGHEVIADVKSQVERGLGVSAETMDFGGSRSNLAYEVIPVRDDGAKERELLSLLAACPDGARLVYCATVRGVRDVTERLRARGIPCAMYHGQLPPNAKQAELERFLGGEVATVVATSAFGMGIDKPDIRLVVHHDLPGSIEDYVQETGRAGRDGDPARCVLLFDERDLETQFYLKTAGLVTERDVRVVFQALRRRALRLAPEDDGWVVLWVSPEELFVAEELENELDWAREGLQGRLKLVLYHLEADGVAERLENRTRTFAVHPLAPSLAAALALLAQPVSPATERVVRYLYDPARPRELSILDLSDECGLSPAEGFRELHKLTEAKAIGQDLRFGVTAARGVPRSTEERTRHHLAVLTALCELDDSGEDSAVLGLRAAASEIGRRLRAPCPPHELLGALRALRRIGQVRLDKIAPGRFRVTTEGGFAVLRRRLGDHRRAADALLAWVDSRLVGQSGRDLRLELDVQRFLDDQRTLFNRVGADSRTDPADALFAAVERDAVVETCLLLHHLEAWHLTDPPVLFDIALKVRVDPRRTVRDLDRSRPRRQREHEIGLVHLLREYAVLPPNRRASYLEDYFRLPRTELLDRWFAGRRRVLHRPVTAATESAILAGLTEAQAVVVVAEEPALLVVAGPGAGKTHTIVRRVSHLMRARQVRAEEILVLAFSRAAAAELRTRLVDAIGERARHLRVRTFHGLALELTGDALDEDRRDAEAWLDTALVRAAELLNDPEGELMPDGGHGSVVAVGERGEAASSGRTAVRAATGDAAGEEHRARVLGGIRHVLVDEYQDLDPAQYAMLTGIVGAQRRAARGKRAEALEIERSVMVVGDDDQAIFSFRKASVEFIRRFEVEFGARRLCLVESFRSHPRIVAATNELIRTLAGRVKQVEAEQIRAIRRGNEASDARAVRRFAYADALGLAAHLRRVVERSLAAGVGSVAVLAREWSDLGTVRGQLEMAGVAFALAHRGFHRPIHRRYLCDRVLRHLWRAPRVIEGGAVGALTELLAGWGRSDDPAAADLLELVREVDVERGPGGGPGSTWATIGSRELADRILLASREGARQSGNGKADARVHLGTFHGAKGREFDKVILLPVVPRSGADLDEERRLYYVAMTRARDELVLTTCGERGELALEVSAPSEDLTKYRDRLPTREIAYFDCEPGDVVLHSVELARAQGLISSLREGAPLEVREENGRIDFWPTLDQIASAVDPAPLDPGESPLVTGTHRRRYQGFVATLATRGRARYALLRRHFGVLPMARVHEVYVHLQRNQEGVVKSRVLVAIPTLRFERA
ncbi:MAG: RecQ family ATP-dependent DNA helicase [Polyangiaceae bacterium]|nr:RecQ family ATP-dependent DNA helicase [Polyangiaceae bacterium]